jgi:hypothetical protein
MLSTIFTRTAHMTAAVVSATLLTAFVTILPVPAQAELKAVHTVVPG